jgi:hypothetical protein
VVVVCDAMVLVVVVVVVAVLPCKIINLRNQDSIFIASEAE